MKRNFFYAGALLALALAGCQQGSDESASSEESVEVGPKYNAKSGLFVPEETWRSIGLELVDVSEQAVSAEFEVQLRVYRVSKGSALASATVTPEEAKTLREGQRVVATTSGGTYEGRVTRVSDALQQATGMAELLVDFGATSHAPDVGVFLGATVELDSDTIVTTIPRRALLESSDGPSVYVVSGDHFVRAQVEVGVMSGDVVEIRDGLYTGDQVVLQPVMSLWLTELAAVKGGQACCVMPAKGK